MSMAAGLPAALSGGSSLPLFAEDQDRRRWGTALATVLGLHAVALAIAAQWQTVPPLPEEDKAIAVELAPLPVADHLAVAASSPAAAPAPAQAVQQPQPPQDMPKPVERAEVALPPRPLPPVPAPAAPTPAPLPAPMAGAAGNGPASSAGMGRGGADAGEAGMRGGQPGRGREGGGDAAAVWRGRVLAHLERHKRYPAAARMMKREGKVHVSISMDRRGHVLSVSVSRGTGFKPFDTEALDTVRRADPLPEPPAELAGNTIPLQLPIGFYLPGGS